MQPTPRRRRSWLGAIRVVLLVVLVLDFISLPLILLPIQGEIRLGTVSLIDLWSNKPVLPPSTHPELSAQDVTILLGVRPGLLQYILYKVGHGFVDLAVTIPILIYARRIANTARLEDPFTLVLVKRLRRLGFLILGGGAFAELTNYVTSKLVLDIYLNEYHAEPLMRFDALPDYTPSLWWVLPGLILLGVSEIVRRGVDLRAELDTVI